MLITFRSFDPLTKHAAYQDRRPKKSGEIRLETPGLRSINRSNMAQLKRMDQIRLIIQAYLDGFNNKITMHAYANPDTKSNGAGYGLIKFMPKEQKAVFECWPREVDVSSPEAKQFRGWPITVELK
jgi:hypothetical protein